MSKNVEIVRNAFDSFARDDIQGVLRLCSEDIVVAQPRELPGVSPRQRGHSGVLEAFSIWPEQWDDYQIEILRIAGAGDYVVVTARTGGRGKQSGVGVEMDFSFSTVKLALVFIPVNLAVRLDGNWRTLTLKSLTLWI